MFSLHPSARIAAWIFFAACVGWMRLPAMLVTSGLLVALLAFHRSSPFFRLLYRARWLLLSLVVLYGLTFPGRLLFPSLGALSPTSEGVVAGGLQAWRLALLLAALAVLHASCNRNCLIGGLFRLLWPLRYLGVNVSRVAGRIWLTLDYAEDAGKWTRSEWHRLLEGELDDSRADAEDSVIRVEVAQIGWRDGLLLLAFALVLAGLARW